MPRGTCLLFRLGNAENDFKPAVASEVEHIVKLERECCAFLDFELSRRGDGVELTIVGPGQPGSDAQWLFSQFLPENTSAAQPPGCACRNG